MKPPLELAVEVTDASGTTYRWGSERTAGDIPQNVRFGTRQGDGFADASITLSRRIDQELVGLDLLNDVVIYLADGTVVYEGRIVGIPRSLQDTHSITVTCAGHMAHAKDRRFQEIYVDRDLGSWEESSRARQVSLLASNYKWSSGTVQPDETNGAAALRQSVAQPWTRSISESAYRSPTDLASVYYEWQQVNANVANFEWGVAGYSDDDFATLLTSSGDLQAAGPGSGTLTLTTAGKYLRLWILHAVATTGSEEHYVWWKNLAVYGNHGLTKRGDAPQGFYASDVIENIVERFCPRLNTDGVQGTTFPIPHLVFRDPTFPYDAFLEVNKYHQWQLAVWENRTLHFHPHDLTAHDWEIRLSDRGVSVDLQGDSASDLANGIEVDYTSVTTGRKERLTPEDTDELRDTSLSNPANRHGDDLWTGISLSSPTTEAAAIQFGRIVLAEFNAPKAPGSITLRGHVKDAAGHLHPVSKIRAGQTLVISDHPNDAVRLIVETSYDHQSQTMSVSVDNTRNRVGAVVDRQANALQAAGL